MQPIIAAIRQGFALSGVTQFSCRTSPDMRLIVCRAHDSDLAVSASAIQIDLKAKQKGEVTTFLLLLSDVWQVSELGE